MPFLHYLERFVDILLILKKILYTFWPNILYCQEADLNLLIKNGKPIMLCEKRAESRYANWNQPVSDKQFDKEMYFNNGEISIDNVDFDSINPRNIVDALLGETFARD
jgi:hypothetical protein